MTERKAKEKRSGEHQVATVILAMPEDNATVLDLDVEGDKRRFFIFRVNADMLKLTVREVMGLFLDVKPEHPVPETEGTVTVE